MSQTQRLINSIIDNAISIGNSKSAQADAYARQAVSAASSWASMGPIDMPAVRIGNIEPPVNIPRNAAGVDLALYNSTYDRIIADLTGKFADFFAEFFPNECNSLAAAQAWMCDVLTNGGSGIRPEIEEQIWQRERSRTLRAAHTAGETVLEAFAARGFPVPPGAAQHQMHLMQQKALEEIAASNRQLAIKQMELEIENIRLAVTNALDYRVKGIAAAADYIRALALAPQIASDMATSSANAQAQLISAASSYYNARIRLEEIKIGVRNHDIDIEHDRNKTWLGNNTERLGMRVQAVTAVAQSLGQQAGAALNAIHAQAGASLNDSL